MRTRFAHGWRALRTGVAFTVFGAGAVTLAAVFLPLLRLLPGTPQARQLRAQWLVHLSFRFFAWFMETLGLFRLSRMGTDLLRRPSPCLVVANHPTLIDVVLLIACLPQADCIVKKASWRNRFLRGVVSGAGYIPNSEGTGLVDDCVDRLHAGRRLLLFPEGTRSPGGRLGHFRRGAARIALQSGYDMLPVVITCDPPTLMKGQKWYEVPDRTPDITLEVCGRIAAREYLEDCTNPALAARRLTEDLRAFYETRLRCAPFPDARSPSIRRTPSTLMS